MLTTDSTKYLLNLSIENCSREKYLIELFMQCRNDVPIYKTINGAYCMHEDCVVNGKRSFRQWRVFELINVVYDINKLFSHSEIHSSLSIHIYICHCNER